MLQAGGLSAPPAPRLKLSDFWRYLPPLIDPVKLESGVKIWNFWKTKKFAPKKKMKCDNNSIYELQDQLFSLQGTSGPYLSTTRWHFSNFKNS